MPNCHITKLSSLLNYWNNAYILLIFSAIDVWNILVDFTTMEFAVQCRAEKVHVVGKLISYIHGCDAPLLKKVILAQMDNNGKEDKKAQREKGGMELEEAVPGNSWCLL